MMLFEIIFVTILFLSVLYSCNYRSNKGGKVCAIILALSSAPHFIYNGYRWQLSLVYLTFVTLFLLLLFGVKVRSRGVLTLFVLFIIVSTLLSIALPKFQLPETTGKYYVGTKSFNLVDKSREEYFTKDSTDYRELIVKIWYPSETINDIPPEPYWEKGLEGATLSESMGLPSFIFDYISDIKTNSYPYAQIASKEYKFPVIVFSHGYRSYSSINRVIMEELASNGYVVINITHPYEAAVAKLSPDKIVGVSDYIIKKMNKAEILNSYTLEKLLIAEDVDDKKILAKEYANNIPIFTESLENWTKDTIFILDKLPEIDKKYMSNSLDLESIGVVGHSLGGSTATEVAILDPRVKAAVNYDGFLSGSMLNGKELNKPYMLLNSESNKNINSYLYSQLKQETYIYTVRGTFHEDFTDIPLFSPILYFLDMSGTIHGRHIVELTRDYTLAFFNKQFKDTNSILLGGNSGYYPEVDVNLLQKE